MTCTWPHPLGCLMKWFTRQYSTDLEYLINNPQDLLISHHATLWTNVGHLLMSIEILIDSSAHIVEKATDCDHEAMSRRQYFSNLDVKMATLGSTYLYTFLTVLKTLITITFYTNLNSRIILYLIILYQKAYQTSTILYLPLLYHNQFDMF